MERGTSRGRAGPYKGRRRVKQQTAELTPQQQWLGLWSEARYDLNLTDEQFYRLTPRQFEALRRRKKAEQQLTEFLSAQIVSSLINFSMCRPEKMVSPQDFMPSEWGKTKSTRKSGKIPITKARRDAVTASFRAGLQALRNRTR